MADYIAFDVKCPHCKEKLMDDNKKINGKPSIALHVKNNGRFGNIYLCSFYGCYKHESTIELKKDDVYTLSCRSCQKELTIKESCEKCEAPLVGLSLDMGGKLQFCSRNGCDNHYVAFQDVTTAYTVLKRGYGA
jgi:hypothetical protein